MIMEEDWGAEINTITISDGSPTKEQEGSSPTQEEQNSGAQKTSSSGIEQPGSSILQGKEGSSTTELAAQLQFPTLEQWSCEKRSRQPLVTEYLKAQHIVQYSLKYSGIVSNILDNSQIF